MTCALIPTREEMTAKVAEMPTAAVLATFCRFVSATQTIEEQNVGSTIFENKVGVSKVHAKRSARLLNQVKRGGPVSSADIQYATKIVVHYRRQIFELGLIAYD